MQEHWNVLPFPSLGDLFNPGIKPAFLALAGKFFTTEPPGKPHSSSRICEFNHFVALPARQNTEAVKESDLPIPPRSHSLDKMDPGDAQGRTLAA